MSTEDVMRLILRVGILCWIVLAASALVGHQWEQGQFYALMLIAMVLLDYRL